jgi:hypothetical protein
VTLFVNLAPAAAARFAGLDAPSTEVVLAPGRGAVQGDVHLGYLAVLGVAAPQIQLFGTLGAVGGPAAASNGIVVPVPQINYTINGCVIGMASCTAMVLPMPLAVPPPGDPLDNFDIMPPRRRRLDQGVTLPNIATKDY